MSTAWTVASQSLQSARREPNGAWRGYAMQFAAWSQWPDSACAYPGAQVAAASEHLAESLSHLVDLPLHEVLSDASDAGVLRDVAQHWPNHSAPELARLRLSSSAMAGADLTAEGKVLLWRRYRLRCAHFLPNVPLGHKCGRLHGHDFEVVLHVAQSDAIADHEAIDQAWAPWHIKLNYQRLNDLNGLGNPTSEMLAAWLWQALQPDVVGLRGVTVFETASCGAFFDGESHRIWKDFSFDSATRLSAAPVGAPEAGVHGHTYHLRLVLNAPMDPVMGWAMDFGDVKQVFAPVFNAFDHQPLFEREELAQGDTATIAKVLHREALAVLPSLERTLLLDSDGGGADVSEQAPHLPLPL